MVVSRRDALRTASRVCLGANFSFLASRPALAAFAGTSGKRLFELPSGFSSTVIDSRGNRMSDGYNVPGRPDGMGCFPGRDGNLILMRNHEVSRWDLLESPYRIMRFPSDNTYDRTGCGGVTRLVFDPRQQVVLSRNLVLEGTARNCAGGMSPWGWLSCEETVEEGHGYVFLCDPNATQVQAPRPIRGYGRFNHEAATVHPSTFVAYLTEDRDDGCFYRFVPNSVENPFDGKLQALAIVGEPQFHTGQKMPQRDTLAVEWVNVDNPDPADDSVRLAARAKGAAVVSRGEGLWLDGDDVYFSSTTGGKLGKGQIFRLSIDATNNRETLGLVAESKSTTELNMPDNITVAPWGDLVIAEDSKEGNCLRLVKATGEVRFLARNVYSDSELAGVCFDPTGTLLFVNMQSDGLTLVISGPFREWAS